MWHDKIQEIIITFLDSPSINYATSSTTKDELKASIIINNNRSKYSIDITEPFYSVSNIVSAARSEIEKYSHLAYIIPFCVGSLVPDNYILEEEFKIPEKICKSIKNDT